MRVLVVSNFGADESAPQRGRWVDDQVDALRSLGLTVDLYSFRPGKQRYLPAIREIRRRIRGGRYDLVHAHYGLAGWCAWLAGARPLIVTFHGTDVRHRVVGPTSRLLTRRLALTAVASRALFSPEGGRPGLPMREGRSAVLPTGGDIGRFRPSDRTAARRQLGLDPDRPFALFPANPGRPEKRSDRAELAAREAGVHLVTGGRIPPDEMPLWIAAANAVLVTSEYEGFGLTCLESLACEVPVLSTPVGIAPHALAGLPDCLCEPFEAEPWARHLKALVASGSPPVAGGRRRAEALSAARLGERVAIAYGEILERHHGPAGNPVTVSAARFGNDGGN